MKCGGRGDGWGCGGWGGVSQKDIKGVGGWPYRGDCIEKGVKFSAHYGRIHIEVYQQ